MVTMYQLKTGATQKIKCRKACFEKNPIEVGQVIKLIERTIDKKFKCITNPETGKKEFERTDEDEVLLTRYQILKKSSKNI